MHQIFLLAAIFIGCGQREVITSYRVKKPELVDPTLVSAASAPASPASEQQTLGLIVPVGERNWFFKLTGEVRTVEPQHEDFLRFATSIKFGGGRDGGPTWTLPAGWKELPGSGFRFATIQIPAEDKPLELSVSEAGGDLLANVNRWRDQLKLPRIAPDTLAENSKSLKIDGHEATLVSLIGMGSGQMGGAPFAPFAGGGAKLPVDHPPVDSGKGAVSAKATASGDLRYDAPSEWLPGKASAFSLAAFKVTDGDKQADITVSTAGGDLLSNVNRWRGQLGLSPMDAAELAKAVQKIETLGSTGSYVEIVGPAGAKREVILGVQAEAAGRTWFVKLKGDAQLAEREKPRFEAFVKSLKIP